MSARLFAIGRRGGPSADGWKAALDRVVIESAADEESIRLGRGVYVATMTREEFVTFLGWDVPPGEVVAIEILRARRLEAA